MNKGIVHIELDKDLNFIDVLDRENLTAEEGTTLMIAALCSIYKAIESTVDKLEDAIEEAWEQTGCCDKSELEAKHGRA